MKNKSKDLSKDSFILKASTIGVLNLLRSSYIEFTGILEKFKWTISRCFDEYTH